ncbi:sterigmatocystin 7-O-methyltransferase precursor [Fusarium mundagurra]|uniref:Sterigmatocystin 7-O-methyltransferase n=1 Tax=Fusarium mundagurra TaxID=1567541 RepID=A0A8H6DNK1_9HYPO|nr:sterigmatocystin 7-O-methyltransferase precursor [Fusarium mundagurra]
MATANNSNLLQLAETIQQVTETVVKHLQDTKQQEPSFDQNSKALQSDADIHSLRNQLNGAAQDLLRLVNGPANEYRSFFMSHYTLAAYQVALHFKLFRHVPLGGKVSIAHLASKAGIDVDRCRRVIKHLATQRVFEEVEPDVFTHTASSALIARDSDMEAILWMQFDEMFKAASDAAKFVQNDLDGLKDADSPFATRHGKPPYQWYAENPDKGLNFAKAMAALTQMDRSITALRDGFQWDKLEAPGKVVDVGGASGHVSMDLAALFPNLTFVVQDISPEALEDGRAKLPSEIADRVSFMQHDFFKDQPITDANAFFMRQCLHNWRDEDCIKILRALIPALEKCKRGTPLLINEEVLPELNEVSKYREHLSRQCDMCMFVAAGSKERTRGDFEKLLKEADSRFKVVKVHRNSASTMGLVEAYLG